MHDQINAQANTILVDSVCGFGAVVCDCQLECGQPGAGAHRAPRVGTGGTLGAGREHCSSAPSLLAESLVLCGSGALAAVLLAIPMVAVLGHYAARF